MKKINDLQKLNFYIKQYNIDEIFSSDMTEYMELHLFNKDEHIYRSGDPITYFYFLIDGKLKIYTLLENGKSLLLRFYKPLSLIGDIEISYNNIIDCHVEVIKQALCIGISIDNINKYAFNDPIFLRYLCKSLSQKLIIGSVSNSINLLYPLENRLASYLLSISSSNEINSISTIKTTNLTHIAELLGTSYRHLLRVINKLCALNIIKRDKKTIIILDRDSLVKLAGDIYK